MLRNSLPPMNALRTFEVAGRRLSFRAAADEIGVTQGAVAQQIRLLEAHLGLSLFTRLPRGVALTNRGATYHAEISRAFAIMREATAGLDQGDRNLTISVTPTFATKLLIPQLSSLNETLPRSGDQDDCHGGRLRFRAGPNRHRDPRNAAAFPAIA